MRRLKVQTVTDTWKQLPPVGTLLRGLFRRCPRCGSGKVFRHWFAIRETCPRCALKFEREPGFFLGAYTMNLAFMMIAAVLVIVIGFSLRAPGGSILPMMFAGLGVTLLLPPFLYPFSLTLWCAVDLIMQRTLGRNSNNSSNRPSGARR
jgi:uncharacterized protein (DUF983 family)